MEKKNFKKQYDAPKMEVVYMRTEGHLLAGSGGELDPLSPFNV